jgi:integrase
LQSSLFKKGKIKSKTINNVIGLACKIFTDAQGWGHIAMNPAVQVRRIRCPETDYQFWTFVERDKFLSYVKNRDSSLFKIVAFAVNTGLRRGEVEALCRDCIDLERREVIVKRNYCHKTHTANEYTKGKNIRRVPMNAVVYEILNEYRSLAPHEPIFTHDFQHMVTRQLNPLQKDAGVRVISFHDLRHTFASHLAMSGVSPFDIQKLLGHSDIKTTMRYTHLSPDHLRGVTDVLVNVELENNCMSEDDGAPKRNEVITRKLAIKPISQERKVRPQLGVPKSNVRDLFGGGS